MQGDTWGHHLTPVIKHSGTEEDRRDRDPEDKARDASVESMESPAALGVMVLV